MPGKHPAEKQILQAWVPKSLIKALDALAKEDHGLSRGRYVTKVLEDHVRRKKAKS